MRFRIQRRWTLIVLVCAVQLICLVTIGCTAINWLKRGVTNDMHTQVLKESQLAACQMSSLMGELGVSIYWIGGVNVVAMAVLTGIASACVVRRYESSIERINEQLERKVASRSSALLKTRNAVIFGLAKLSESRDTDTGQHLERIRRFVTILARELQKMHREITDELISNLALASSLHDIGKVGIPDSILLKPGNLTPDERNIMERHTMLGGQCLEAVQQQLGTDDFLELAKTIAYFHHEHWDGQGYPFGLRGERIPLAARIVALADVYDALTSRRPYKRAFDHEEACELILDLRGTQFDPQVVDAFLVRQAEFRLTAEELRQDAGDFPGRIPQMPDPELCPAIV
jgi:response regulator RpfG family c-di-GMP phosphodiesterase